MRDLGLMVGIGIFGAAGAITRYVVSNGTSSWGARAFPTGTLVVNVVGCFLLGIITLSAAGTALSADHRRWLGVGFLGALTTYSTFGVETFVLLERGNTTLAAANIAAQLLLGLLAVWLGAVMGRAIWGAV